MGLTRVHDLFGVSLLRDPDARLDWHVGHYPLEQAYDPNVGVFRRAYRDPDAMTRL